MQRYLFPQLIAFLLMFIGWLIVIGGTILSALYINKTSVLALLSFLPRPLLQKLIALPEWLFFTPAGLVLLLGLLLVGIGHILQVGVESARNSYEAVAMLDMVRIRTTPY